MPNVGDFLSGKEIGQTTQGTTRFIYHACIDCGKERWVRYIIKEQQPCKLRCRSCAKKGISTKHKISAAEHQKRSVAKQGEKNPNYGKCGSLSKVWRGGRRNSDGYIRVWVSKDDFFYSMADISGTVAEHRLIIAQHLRRCLLPWEVVHHKNGKRNDNRMENLELITDKRFHSIDANAKSYIARLERRITKLEEIIRNSMA